MVSLADSNVDKTVYNLKLIVNMFKRNQCFLELDSNNSRPAKIAAASKFASVLREYLFNETLHFNIYSDLRFREIFKWLMINSDNLSILRQCINVHLQYFRC